VDKEQVGPVALAGRSNLFLRVAASLVLAPLAIAAAYWGGLAFHAFWSIAALVVLWEWDTLVCEHDRNPVLTIGAVALVGSSLLLAFDWVGTAIVLVALGLFGVATLASSIRRGWCAAGLVYAAALMMAPVILRYDATLGFAAILFLFTVVWLTDIVAYFVGRAAGGPKLLARVSPNKTWSGAIGGTLAAVIGGVVVAKLFGVMNLAAVGAVAFVLSVIAQLGDLLESAIKRQFGAKDASSLIPGHGGLMDRLDGFLTASVAAALIGLVQGGFQAPAQGLMVW
jgi:phosphatidate cytidylyltransferase